MDEKDLEANSGGGATAGRGENQQQQSHEQQRQEQQSRQGSALSNRPRPLSEVSQSTSSSTGSESDNEGEGEGGGRGGADKGGGTARNPRRHFGKREESGAGMDMMDMSNADIDHDEIEGITPGHALDVELGKVSFFHSNTQLTVISPVTDELTLSCRDTTPNNSPVSPAAAASGPEYQGQSAWYPGAPARRPKSASGFLLKNSPCPTCPKASWAGTAKTIPSCL